ncbi:hypothetical protein BKI52_38805 [marine bacterium AO1-C]|nr:hypothetical protein BKI52_38805 [marine bacterium AO1-C]
MKQLFIILLSFLLACSSGEQSQQKAETTNLADSSTVSDTTQEKPKDTVKVIKNLVPSGNEQVDRISEIKQIPHVTFTQLGKNNRVRELHCGDAFFWQIVQMGEEAIPYLITKVQDSTKTNIKIPCQEEYLNVGTVAYVLLSGIVNLPTMLVFDMQFDSFNTDCNLGYADGMLEYINNRPKDAHKKLTRWYRKYKSKITKEKIKFDNEPDCRKQHNIVYRLKIEYD